MTPKERAAMQQALEDFLSCEKDYIYDGENEYECDSINWDKRNAAITALREALAEQAEQEPVALDEIRRIVAEYIEPNSQVDSGNLFWALCGALQYIDVNLKFSAIPAPVRTKDLTDEEIWATYDAYSSNLEFARAVIAKDRSKNGIV